MNTRFLAALLLSLLGVAIRASDPDAEESVRLGIAEVKQSKYSEAVKHLTLAIDKNPTNPEAHYYRGLAFSHLGKADFAMKDFDASIQLDSTFPKAYVERGKMFAAKLDRKAAIADMTAANALTPKDPEPLYWRGVIYYDSAEYSKAIEDFQQTVKLDPENPSWWIALGKVFTACPDKKYRSGKRAIECANKAKLLFDPKKDYMSLEVLAAAHAELGDYQEAAKYQKAAIDVLSASPLTIRTKHAKSILKLYEDKKPRRVKMFCDWN